MLVLTDFFMPNQKLKPDFRYLIRFLQGCHFAIVRILTWQPCKHSLDHILGTIHSISEFFFAKSTIFFILNPIQTVKCPYLSRILQGCQIPHFHLATLQNSWQIWAFDCLNWIQHEKISWFCKKKFQNRMNGVRNMVQWVFTGLPGQNTVHGIMATLQKPYEISKIRFQILIRHEKIC